MFSLVIVLLSFSSSLTTKCLFLNDEPCMARPTLVDFELKPNLNSFVLKYIHL